MPACPHRADRYDRIALQERMRARSGLGSLARVRKGGYALRIVWSHPLMEHSYRVIRRMRYGTGFTWERTTTEAVRRAIQHSQESLRALARRYGVNPKTIAKWKAHTSVSDLPTGPRKPRSTTLSVEEEAVAVAFRRHTLLPLDDCLYALQPTIPPISCCRVTRNVPLLCGVTRDSQSSPFSVDISRRAKTPCFRPPIVRLEVGKAPRRSAHNNLFRKTKICAI
jgi:transposase-like protein